MKRKYPFRILEKNGQFRSQVRHYYSLIFFNWKDLYTTKRTISYEFKEINDPVLYNSVLEAEMSIVKYKEEKDNTNKEELDHWKVVGDLYY